MPNTNRVHRQLVCLPRGEGKVLLSWRLLPTDRADAPFQVERRREASDTWVRVSEIPVTDSTTLLDRVPEPRRYEYRVVGDGVSEVVSVDAGAAPDIVALSIPLDPEMFSGWGLLMALGELCNDGRIGYIVRGARGGRLWILAYDHDGQLRWERNTYLPPGENGDAYHVPLLCWDVNADGRSEVVFYTGQPDDPREHYGVPEVGQCLTAVDGETGEVVWEAPSLMVADAMTVGHLRGIDQAASVVVQERTYADVTLTAYDGRTGAVSWQVDQARPAGHALDIADIDEDGVQEVICGGVCYRGDGTVKWEAEQLGMLISRSRRGLTRAGPECRSGMRSRTGTQASTSWTRMATRSSRSSFTMLTTAGSAATPLRCRGCSRIPLKTRDMRPTRPSAGS